MCGRILAGNSLDRKISNLCALISDHTHIGSQFQVRDATVDVGIVRVVQMTVLHSI